MELKEQASPLTLARALGDVTHASPLLHKVCQISGLGGEDLQQWLLKCAVQRGAGHYRRTFPTHLPPDDERLSDEEIGIALCLGHHTYDSHLIRAAAQLLSSSRVDPQKLARLATLERCESVLLHIADASARLDANRQPWAYLRAHLSQRNRRGVEALPHWSRFVSMTGLTRAGPGLHTEWLQRHEQPLEDSADAR